jgi:disulfide bond formation protein DsbB
MAVSREQMSTAQISTTLAVLAIVTAVLTGFVILGYLLALLRGPRRVFSLVFDEFRWLVRGITLPLAWLIAAVATAGSLYFSLVAHFTPCDLCWYQRIAMYPLAIILLGVAVSRRRELVPILLPLPLIGLGIALWHHYEEQHPARFVNSCQVGVPCTTKWINEFGFVTIPVLDGTAFAAIIVLLLLAWRTPSA